MNEMEEKSSGISMHTIGEIFRFAGVALGVLAIVFGLIYSVRIFDNVYSVLRDPAVIDSSIDRWEDFIGSEHIVVEIDGTPRPIARLLAIVTVGMGTLLLIWIAMGLMSVGAKVISLSIGETAILKRLVRDITRADKSKK